MRKPTPRPTPLPPDAEFVPRADPNGSLLALVGLALTSLCLTGNSPSAVASSGAIGVGLSVAATVIADARQGLRNLIRADVMALLALYFLTLFEFLFSQPAFDTLTNVIGAHRGVTACLWGFAGLIAGRHLVRVRKHPWRELFTREVSGSWMLVLFATALLLGFLHMLIAVKFDVFEMVDYFMAPRFWQPWSRSKLGDWRALIFELGMLLYLVPPIAGIILARRKQYGTLALLSVSAGFLFLLFYGFSTGTRNLFASYLITFLIAYAFAAGLERKRELIAIGIACALLMMVATVVMLQFRTVGLSNYVAGTYEHVIVDESSRKALFVDYNLYAICNLAALFPKRYPYLGFEVPYQALIRPIPRAIWPGKPEGLSVTIEDALGVEGITIASSFVGEAYMSGGWFAVLLAGLFFGVVTGWWSQLPTARISQLGILIYASGFFAAVISMRSLFVFSTALLPTIAAITVGSWIVGRNRSEARPRSSSRPPAPPARPPKKPAYEPR